MSWTTGDRYPLGGYYDPATGQFLSVDPLVDVTGQSYAYTGDDPVNGNDPLGLWPSLSDLNPVSDVESLGNAAVQTWNDTGGKAVSYIDQHRTDIEIGAGIVLGVAAAGTGVGAIVEGSVLLAGASVAIAGVGTALDYQQARDGNDLARVGLVLNGVGFLSAAASAGVLVAGDEALSLAFGGFGVNFGLGGLTTDLAAALFGSGGTTCGRAT